MNNDSDSYRVVLHCAVSLRVPWDVKLPKQSLFPIRPTKNWLKTSYEKVVYNHKCGMVNPQNEIEEDFEKRAHEFKKRIEKHLADRNSEVKSLLKNCKHESDNRYSYFDCPYIKNNIPTKLPPELKFSKYQSPKFDVRIITDCIDEPVNEFIVEEKDCNVKKINTSQEIQKVLAYLMALRRSVIFSNSVAIRRHHVFLPLAELTWKKDGGCYKKLYMVPYLTFYRNPDHFTVRRTFTYGVFYVPDVAKPLAIDDCLKLLQSGSASGAGRWLDMATPFNIDGDLKKYVGLNNNKPIPSLGDLEEKILGNLLDRLLRKYVNKQKTKNKQQEDQNWARLKDSILDNQRMDSRIWNVHLLADGLFACDPKSLIGGDGSTTRGTQVPASSAVDKLLKEFYDLTSGDTDHDLFVCAEYDRPNRVCMKSFYGKAKSASMCVLTLYDKAYERFANESVLWLIPWWVFMTSGLSSVNLMIRSFHHELSKEGDIHAFLDISKEFVVDFIELYDLDIQVNRAKDYKTQYAKLKKLAGVELNYGRLKEEIQALGHQLEVRYSYRLTIIMGGFAIFVALIAAVIIKFA